VQHIAVEENLEMGKKKTKDA